MNIKGFVIALLLVVFPFVRNEAGSYHYLVVNAKDGTKTTFVLSEKPKITCNNGDLKIVAGYRTFSVKINDLYNYTFSDESTGIVGTRNDSGLAFDNGKLFFSNLKAGSKIMVYSQDGKIVEELSADNEGSAIVNLINLPKGLLIIHSNTTDIKFNNK